MRTLDARKALIYCRVSSKRQTTEGGGLNSQEHRCRQYAASKGYAVDKVFQDEVTGGGDFMNRPGMAAMLKFLSKMNDDYVVIFDDLKRFARDTVFHLKLRQRLAAYNATVECLNFTFEDSPEGHFVETIVAAQGELERLQNRRQVLQKMKARLERGFYVFAKPNGYRYQKTKDDGNVLVRDEPLASIIQEALEGYASGRFQIQAEVKKFLETHPEFPHDANGIVHPSRVTEILTRPVYAGYLSAPDWKVPLQKGRHEALISFETYQKIQSRLKGQSHAAQRRDLNEDFPLRGSVVCGHCNAPLTASWSKGRKSEYPYYLCIKRGCESYGKSIRRDVIEGHFEGLLEDLHPAPSLINAARQMFADLWNNRLASSEGKERSLKNELKKIEKEVEQFLDRIADTNVPSVITAYENRIRKLEEQKFVLQEKVAVGVRPVKTFDDSLRTALEFLANPLKLWASERFEDKRVVLKLTFVERLVYMRNEGFRTADLSLPFKALGQFARGEIGMVGPLGLEPRTKGFTLPHRFRREWTISSPTWGAGRSCLSLSAT